MIDLSKRTKDDEAAIERLEAASQVMLARTLDWSRVNTGSWNINGLKGFAPTLADAFCELDADVQLEPSKPFEIVQNSGAVEMIETAPVLRVRARPEAETQVIFSGHYDTVFPPGQFEEIVDLGNGRINGPGLADMKGGLVVMLEAIKAFEAGPHKDALGYQIVVTPDEEIGNFASEDALIDAVKSGAQIGMTYEPCLETGDMAGGRKGSSVYDVVFHGIAAHAGRAKAEGASALEAAAAFTLGLEALNGQRDGVTVNVGSIDGGAPVNIVPNNAVVRFGARAPDVEAAQWIDQQVRALFDVEMKRRGITGHIHGGFYRPPKLRNAAQGALFQAVSGTGRALGLELAFVDTGGVCEGNNIFAAGAPNVDTLGVRGGRIHSNEEFVETDSFAERAALSTLILNRLADGRVNAKQIKALMGA